MVVLPPNITHIAILHRVQLQVVTLDPGLCRLLVVWTLCTRDFGLLLVLILPIMAVRRHVPPTMGVFLFRLHIDWPLDCLCLLGSDHLMPVIG